MVFSSLTFLFLFLPIALAGNFLLRNKIKLQNIFFLLFSILFYAWGEPKFVLAMAFSIVWNWGMAQGFSYFHEKAMGKALFIAALAVNIGILFVFKYLNFTIFVWNQLWNTGISIPGMTLPIGISFFTFQGLSYLIDIWRKDAKAEKSLINVGLYISFFPQLIAGPIVRYLDIKEELVNRSCTWDGVEAGILRFLCGFSKKVLLANNLALFADQAFSFCNEGSGVNTIFAWGGILAYTLQIYYDFSGYSDMAIGLGRIFGFHFPENFNHPYMATSVTDFWRRWHMSLSGWFRDYVYIPLGGNRVCRWKWIRNLMLVWLLTGLWHGANYTYMIWGIFYGGILVFEKLTGISRQPKRTVGHWIYTVLFVMAAWVIFRSKSLTAAVLYLKSMFWWNDGAGSAQALLYLSEFKVFLIAGVVLAFPLISERIKETTAFLWIRMIGLFLLFLISLSYLAKGAYNPFIYFNF